MTSTYAEMATDVRTRLSVNVSFEASITGIIRRAAKRLLRDYHFPKSISQQTWDNLVLDQKEYTLPAGFKQELRVSFYDPAEDMHDRPLLKRESHVPSPRDNRSEYYWLQGDKLITDIKLPEESVGISLNMWYESQDVDAAESWLVGDFEDVLFSFSMFRAAAELRKTDLVKVWDRLWQADQLSIAIYLNELEFGNSHLQMNQVERSRNVGRYGLTDQ